MQYSKCGLTIVMYNGMINVFAIYVMFLLISPNIWLPFATASPNCSEAVTPRSFSFTLVPNYSIAHKVFFVHITMSNNICHFSDDLTKLVRSSGKVPLSASMCTVLNTFVSSAILSSLLDKLSSK